MGSSFYHPIRIWLIGLVVWFGSGCHDSPPKPSAHEDASLDGTVSDASDKDSDPRRVGSPNTWELATWNLRNFPSSAQALDRAAKILAVLDLDLLAVQEIASVEDWEQLLARLPDWEGVLSEDVYSDGSYQKTGFLFRRGQVRLSGARSLFGEDKTAFPRPPLEASFELSGPAGAFWSLRLLDVHLKAGGSANDFSRRRGACEKLKAYLDEERTSGTEKDFVLLGDFNDDPADPQAENIFNAFLSAPESYRVLTLPHAQRGEYSYIPGRSLLDNVVVTAPLAETAPAARLEIVPVEGEFKELAVTSSLTDHRPVVWIVPNPH